MTLSFYGRASRRRSLERNWQAAGIRASANIDGFALSLLRDS